MAYWSDDVPEFEPKRQLVKDDLAAGEAGLVGCKPPAAVSVCIFIGDIHDFGAAAYLSNRASSLEQGSAESPAESSSKLVGHNLSGST